MAYRGARRRRPMPMRGYGPVIVFATLFAVMLVLVPAKSPTTSLAAIGPGPVTPNEVASGGDTVRPCPDGRTTQITADPYAPPCLEWTGADNGGATYRGVTSDTITVSYRNSGEMADMAASVPSESMPAGIDPSLMGDAAMAGTLDALVEYFNRNFQFYGRRIKLVRFEASGNALQELTGAGQQQAEADAVHVLSEIEAFADVSGTPTQPYASALAAKKVISLAAPSPSDQYFASRRPFVWSFMPSCTTTARASSELLAKSLAGKPARWAGDPALQGATRRIAVISPEGQEYQACTAAGLEVLRAAGADAVTLSYPLDIGNLAKAAEDLLNRLVVERITTVALAGDPLLPMNLTGAATKVGYRPEWVIMGNALSDNELLSQLYDQSQWAHAFGISVMGRPLGGKESPAYRAFKSVRPNEEPGLVVDGVYNQLYLLAIGIQMAGPNLTPESYERGMLAYPEHTGPSGTWRFEPGRFTPQTSAQLLWWDTTATGSNGAKGAFRYAGESWPIGRAPAGEPAVFTR
jgi:hypothetical protein